MPCAIGCAEPAPSNRLAISAAECGDSPSDESRPAGTVPLTLAMRARFHTQHVCSEQLTTGDCRSARPPVHGKQLAVVQAARRYVSS
jgi:hypothetical protein